MSPCAYACSNCLDLRLWVPQSFYSATSSASFRIYSYQSFYSRFSVFIAYATALG
ncbi:hypothetical protein BDV98DRAFT_573549 [Pterulicium gracile]|uniref:Uncharacterized protein n=1 Tax=Pterulicium gracile TaxID=1884261 RepID=A0A5C3Q7T7_9AGAR|nr:hypothetical protein BDV98DRAFT_573549 [Pterula gracilis]